jgi:hypothetical protein
MPPTVPINHYVDFRKPTEQKRRPILSFHARLFRRVKPAWSTLIFSKSTRRRRGTLG